MSNNNSSSKPKKNVKNFKNVNNILDKLIMENVKELSSNQNVSKEKVDSKEVKINALLSNANNIMFDLLNKASQGQSTFEELSNTLFNEMKKANKDLDKIL